MAMKARHAFGSEKDIQKALADGKINEYDILFLDEKKIGWITKDNEVVIAETDLSGIEAELETKASATEVEEKLSAKADATEVKALETKLATKVTAEEVDTKVETAVKAEIEAAVEKTKYEITDVPEGTLVNIDEHEIRIMCPADAVFTKQDVGAGGDANSYYCTLKTFAPCDEAVGYIEHLGSQVDAEILTDLRADANGRRYQPSWLALATYDEATDTWSYYGKSSSESRYIGWDYQIDWYDANGKMIESDSIRISLSNEDCHFAIEPYYVGKIASDMDAKIDTIVEEKIKEINVSYEIVEF